MFDGYHGGSLPAYCVTDKREYCCIRTCHLVWRAVASRERRRHSSQYLYFLPPGGRASRYDAGAPGIRGPARYPEEARKAGIEGTAILSVTITKSGTLEKLNCCPNCRRIARHERAGWFAQPSQKPGGRMPALGVCGLLEEACGSDGSKCKTIEGAPPGFPVELGGVGEPHAAFFMKAAHAHPIGKPDWSQLDPLFVAAGSAKKWVQLCVYAGFFFRPHGLCRTRRRNSSRSSMDLTKTKFSAFPCRGIRST